MDQHAAEAVLKQGDADGVAFGRAYIAYPDLVERLRRRAALNAVHPSTFHYTGGLGTGGYIEVLWHEIAHWLSGLARSAVVTPANVHDKHALPQLLHGEERRVYGDSAYASQQELIASNAPHAKDFTNQRTRRNGEIDEVQRGKHRTLEGTREPESASTPTTHARCMES